MKIKALLREWRNQPMGELSLRVHADLIKRTDRCLECPFEDNCPECPYETPEERADRLERERDGVSEQLKTAITQRDMFRKVLQKIEILAEGSEILDKVPAVTTKTLLPIIRAALTSEQQ
jgi:DNA-binding transcriptional MerR regulator